MEVWNIRGWEGKKCGQVKGYEVLKSFYSTFLIKRFLCP